MIFVNSPFQMLSAAEFLFARAQDGWQDLPVIFLANGSARHNAQTRQVARALGLDFHELRPALNSFKRTKRALSVFMCRAHLRRAAPGDPIVVGNPGYDVFADILARAPDRERWVLDDGALTVSFLDHMQTFARPPQYRHTIDISVRKHLLRYKHTNFDGVRIFTIFGAFFPEYPGIEQNSFALVKSLSDLSRRSRDVWFLGQPMVEKGIMTKNAYRDFCRRALTTLRDMYPESSICYMHHRDDGAAEMDCAGMFDNSFKLDLPIEAVWLEPYDVPMCVAGFCSTALFSLPHILTSHTDVISFWPRDLETGVLSRHRSLAIMDDYVARAARRGLLNKHVI
jgi:hypothetical protein